MTHAEELADVAHAANRSERESAAQWADKCMPTLLAHFKEEAEAGKTHTVVKLVKRGTWRNLWRRSVATRTEAVAVSERLRALGFEVDGALWYLASWRMLVSWRRKADSRDEVTHA